MKFFFSEWVRPHLVRIKTLRLVEFVMNVVWIEVG